MHEAVACASGGGAGTAAAILAQESGAEVIVATKLRHGDANTMMAEGGIQAATKGWKDSPAQHFLDVIEDKVECQSSGEHGLKVVEVLEAACESLKSGGRRIELTVGC